MQQMEIEANTPCERACALHCDRGIHNDWHRICQLVEPCADLVAHFEIDSNSRNVSLYFMRIARDLVHLKLYAVLIRYQEEV